MGEGVNLRMQEINTAGRKMAKYHEDQLGNIKTMISEIRSIVSDGEIFKAEKMSSYINEAMSIFESDVLNYLENTFKMSDEALDIEIKSMTDFDV